MGIAVLEESEGIRIWRALCTQEGEQGCFQQLLRVSAFGPPPVGFAAFGSSSRQRRTSCRSIAAGHFCLSIRQALPAGAGVSATLFHVKISVKAVLLVWLIRETLQKVKRAVRGENRVFQKIF